MYESEGGREAQVTLKDGEGPGRGAGVRGFKGRPDERRARPREASPELELEGAAEKPHAGDSGPGPDHQRILAIPPWEAATIPSEAKHPKHRRGAAERVAPSVSRQRPLLERDQMAQDRGRRDAAVRPGEEPAQVSEQEPAPPTGARAGARRHRTADVMTPRSAMPAATRSAVSIA